MSFIGKDSLRPRPNLSEEDDQNTIDLPSEASEATDDTGDHSLNDPNLNNYLEENQHLFQTQQTSGTLPLTNMPKKVTPSEKGDSSASDDEKYSSSEEETEESDPVQNAINRVSKKFNRKLQMGGGTSINLEHFDVKQHKPAAWFKKFKKFCQFKQMPAKAACRLFPLVVKDDDVAAWIEEIPAADKSDLEQLEKAFLTEFGPENVALYDEKAALHSCKQGRDSAKTFIRKVMARIRELYKISPSEDLSEPHKQVAQTVLMQGLNSSIRAQLALQGCENLEDIIRVAKLADEANRDARADDNTIREMVGSITEKFYEAVQPCLQKITDGVNSIAVVNEQTPSRASGRDNVPGWSRNRSLAPPVTYPNNNRPGQRTFGFETTEPKRVHFQTFGKPEPTVTFNGKCYGCDRWGHRVSECPNRYRNGNGEFNSRVRTQCQLCGMFGHEALRCRRLFMNQPNSNP